MSSDRIGSRVEVSDDEVAAPQASPAPQTPTESKPPQPAKPAPKGDDAEESGTDWVEIDDPKLKARFNRLYRHTKEANEKAARTERQIALLAEQNGKLQKALEAIAGGLKDKETQAELADLKRSAKEAWATGDTEAFMEVNERLLEIKQETKKPPPPPAAEAVAPISPTEKQVLENWQSARNDDGDLLRPWAAPGHPEFAAALDIIQKVGKEPGMVDAPIREILREVDRRMSRILAADDQEDETPNPVRRAFASPRGRPASGERQSTALSNQERVIAEAMFMGGRGSLAKTAKEAHDLYLKQKRLTGRAVAVED
jgi:hypothetical protein